MQETNWGSFTKEELKLIANTVFVDKQSDRMVVNLVFMYELVCFLICMRQRYEKTNVFLNLV